MLASMKDALQDPRLSIPTDVQAQIRGIANYRWREFFEDGPTDLHLAAFYLNPRTSSVSQSRRILIELDAPTGYIGSDIFKDPNPLQNKITVPGNVKSSTRTQVPKGVTHPKTFLKVARFVAHTAAQEIMHGMNPLFTPWRKRGGMAFQSAIEQQFTAYACGNFPFSRPVGEIQATLSWWEEFRGSEDAGLLAVREICAAE